MSFEALGPGALDYLPCRYGTSKLLFRGPRRSLKEPYIAFIGGSETYGKFIANPYPDLVEQQLQMTCLNLGCVNAGIDVFVRDPHVSDMTADAAVTVIQVMGAHNMSNRFYSVHPRRNDRFVKPSTLLEAIFREVDFAEFNFNKHMLQRLHTLSPGRFETVVEELQQAWLARMQTMIKATKGRVILVWFADHSPDDILAPEDERDPWFVTRSMIETLRDQVDDVVEVVASESAKMQGTEGMVFSQMEAPVAKQLMGPAAHQEVAAALAATLENYL